jgi:hypothetical protein
MRVHLAAPACAFCAASPAKSDVMLRVYGM